MVMQSINPTTEEVLESFQEFSPTQVDEALQQAYDAQRRWRTTSFGHRAAALQATARVLRQQKARWAELLTAEMGKPIVEAEAEIDKCAWNCDFYAEHASEFLADEHVPTNATESYVEFQPLGVVLAIMPWNFPFWQVIRFAAPALMAGNGAVLKHASNVPRCALALEEVFATAGLPKGLFRTVLVPGSETTKLIADPRIAAVTLTGSSVVGEQVASAAGKVLKKQVLDLGGSLADQVERSVARGAHAVVGGNPLNGKGYFYAPTVLDGVKDDMPAFREETFGPVAAVIRARDADDAIRIANDTEYGLGSNLWTRDTRRAKELARRIEAGNVFINGMVASDPRLPFGGVKRSGYGRELGVFGIREFVNIQTIVVGQTSAPKQT